MVRPESAFYSLVEAAARWDCCTADIVEWAAVDRVEIVTGIAPARCSGDTVAGLVVVSGFDLLPMFHRCGGGPRESLVRRVREAGKEEWMLISEPQGGLLVDKDDLMIMAKEMPRFEGEYGIFKRVVGGGSGPSLRYDWDRFYLQLIVHIHEYGLPEAKCDLIGKMQDWSFQRPWTEPCRMKAQSGGELAQSGGL